MKNNALIWDYYWLSQPTPIRMFKLSWFSKMEEKQVKMFNVYVLGE